MRGKSHVTIGILAGLQAAILTNTSIGMAGVVTSAIFSLLPDLDEENSTLSNWIVSRKVSRLIRSILLTMLTVAILIYIFITFHKELLTLNLPLYLYGIGTGVFIFLGLGYFITDRKVKRVLMTAVGGSVIAITMVLQLPWVFYIFGGLVAILPWMKHRGITHTVWAIGLVYFFLRKLEYIYGAEIAIMGTAAYASHIFLGDNLTYSGVKLFYPFPFTFKIPLLSTGSLWGSFIEWTIIIAFGFIVLHQLF